MPILGSLKFGSLALAATMAISTPAISLTPVDLVSTELVKVVGGELVLVETLVFLEDAGAANRIVAGDYLRTLSQEVPAAACHVHNDVSTDVAKELLAVTAAKFTAIATALLDGNDAMGIVGAEERLKTQLKLKAILEEWEPIKAAAKRVLQDPSDAEAAYVIYESTDIMLEKTYILLSDLEGQYANPVELLQSDVMLLEISGRMAAMTQRIAYEACRVWSGSGGEKYLADLQEAISIFETSKTALKDGMPSVGIVPAPTEDIVAKLDTISSDWAEIRAHLDVVLAEASLSDEAREDLFTRLLDKLKTSEEVVELYQDYAKRVY